MPCMCGDSQCPSCGAAQGTLDGPEECICGKPNADDEGEWVCPEAPGFCSVACQEKYQEEQRKQDEAEVAYTEAEARLIAAHNAKCPRCKDKRVYCYCETNPENVRSP